MVNYISRHLACQYKRQGFSLVEMAIVLGIVGVLLAGVFTASSVIQYRSLINQASDDLSLTTYNIRNYYTGLAVPGGLSACPSTFTTPITTAVYPKDMLTGAIANNPWNVNSGANTVQSALCGSPTSFDIQYTNIPAAACADLIVRNSLPGRDTGLVQINVNGTMVGAVNTGASATTTPLPITPVDASAPTACSSATANTIDWIYVLNN